MKRSIKVLFTVVASITMMMTTMTQVVLANEDVELSARLNGRGFTAPESLGEAINDTTSLTSAVYDEIDGELYAYSMANGGYFNVLNVRTNELVHSEYVKGVQQVWAHTVTDDHVVYMAALGPGNEGWLLRYNPKLKKVEDLGKNDPGYQYWSIASDGKDNIFIGTFKEGAGKVVKYNIENNKYEDLGVVDAEKNLGNVRSLAYHDNKLYVGMGAEARLYQLDLDTKVYKDITLNAYDLINKPGDKNDIKYVYDLSIVKNHLVARFDHDGMGAVLLYNLKEQKWEDKVLKKDTDAKESYGAFGWNTLVDHDGVTYVSFERQLHQIDTNTLTDKPIGGGVFGFRGAALFDFGEGLEFVTSERLGGTLRIKLVDGKRKQTANVMKGTALKLHNLGKDNNGDLYVSSYPGGPKGAKYTMKDGKYTTYAQSQAEGMIAGKGNTMYFGEYPGAVIKSMNTETLEIETLFNLKDVHEQDRPYIMKFEDDLLLIGTIPDYKKIGGSLSIYNPDTNYLKTYRNVVEGQSIVGLAKKGNYIYGSTSIKGGLDTFPTAKKPVIFVWDIENEKKVKEIELEIPGLNETPMISGLTFDENGMLWGAVDGFLFTLNPETLEPVNYKNIYPNIGNRGMWRPVHIEFGDDGFVYSDVAGKLTVVDPSTDDWDHTTIATRKEVDFMTLSYDNEGNQNVYIVQSDPTDIEVVRVIDVDPLVEDDQKLVAKVLKNGQNFDFEEELNKEGIPGWTSLFENVTENVSFGVTSELAYSGENSMKITDQHDKETVFVISDPIEVEAEKTYTVETMLYLKDGMNTLVLRYYNEEGKQVNKDSDGVNIIHVRSGFNEWRKISATVEAPKDATHARISLGSSNYFVTTGAYYDDIKFYSEEDIMGLKYKRLETLFEQFKALDTKLYTKESYETASANYKKALEIYEHAKELELKYEEGITQEELDLRITQVDIDKATELLSKYIGELERIAIDTDPVDKEPVDKEPVDKEPVDKEPVDKKPVDKEPVDKDTEDNSNTSTDEPSKEIPDETDVDNSNTFNKELPKEKEKESLVEQPNTGINSNMSFYIFSIIASGVLVLFMKKRLKN